MRTPVIFMINILYVNIRLINSQTKRPIGHTHERTHVPTRVKYLCNFWSRYGKDHILRLIFDIITHLPSPIHMGNIIVFNFDTFLFIIFCERVHGKHKL